MKNAHRRGQAAYTMLLVGSLVVFAAFSAGRAVYHAAQKISHKITGAVHPKKTKPASTSQRHGPTFPPNPWETAATNPHGPTFPLNPWEPSAAASQGNAPAWQK